VTKPKPKRFRFLQTGDLHVGRGRGSWGEEKALARAERLFDVLYETAREEKCHALIICGDIFDQKNVTNRERELVSRKLTQGSAAMPTYVSCGNHDLKSKTNSNLDFLAEITENSDEIPNLHVAFSNQEALWEVKLNLSIWAVSCPLSEDQEWIESRVAELPEDRQFVFMGHATIKGCARNDMNWRPEEGKDKGLSLARASTAPNVVWWAFGDIHKRQALPTLASGANGWYAGSPIQMDFGETPNRGGLVVVLEERRGKWVYRGRRYVRMDDKGFAPLVTVTKEEQLDELPEDALIRLGKGLVLPSSRHEQVVKTLPIVDDWSTPEAALVAVAEPGQEGQAQTLEAFDPLMSSLPEVEAEVLDGLPDRDNKLVYSEAKQLVGQAVERYRERTFVS